MKNKFILSIGLLLITLSFNINADDHKNDTNSFKANSPCRPL